jgi:protocatechuate 3,4-dioxygenase beta subunit
LLERLEDRLAPAANITLTRAFLVHPSDAQPLSSIVAGQAFFVQADFNYQDLPTNASYRIDFTVNGLTLTSGYISFGAGIGGSSSGNWFRGPFVAISGQNQVTVTINPDKTVLESTYADNSKSLSFNAAQPTVVNWNNPNGGDWDTATNWSTGVVPNGTDAVVIPTLTNGSTITHEKQISDSAYSIDTRSNLLLSAGSLDVGGSVQLTNASFTVTAGTLSNATVSAGSGSSFFGQGGLLYGVTLQGDMIVSSGSQLSVDFTIVNGSLNNNGIIDVENGAFGGSYYQDLTLNGVLGNRGAIEAHENGQLTLSSQVGALMQNTGNIDLSGSSTLDLEGSWANLGTITAADSTLDFNGSWTNTGTLETTNSTLNLGGSFATAGIGTLIRSGGVVNLAGGLNNTNSTLALNANLGSWILNGGEITGGTIATTDGSELIGGRGTLNGVTLDGNLAVTGNQAATILNGLTLDGTVRLGDDSSLGSLLFAGSQSLSGSGNVVFGSFSPNGAAVNYLGQADANHQGQDGNLTLTVGTGITIGGQLGGVGGSDSGDSLLVQGIVNASITGETIIVSGSITNSGTLDASAGTIVLASSPSGIVNNGSLDVGPTGLVNIVGPFSQTGAGSCNVVLGGATDGQYGRISVNGSALLDGSLNISEANGFTPQLGNEFAFLSFTVAKGEFVDYSGLTPAETTLLQPKYSPQSLSLIAVDSSTVPPVFTAASPPVATSGTPYSYQFQALGLGTHSIIYTATGLPDWATLNSSTGVLSGTPRGNGTFPVAVTADNGVAPPTIVDVSLVVTGQNAVTYNVAPGAHFSVPDGTYNGGTTFNVGANAFVTIDGGRFTGGCIFNVASGAVVDLTGGGNPTFSGTLTGSGSGTVELRSGRLTIGVGGLTFDFPGAMFQWNGFSFLTGTFGDATNLGTMNLSSNDDMVFTDYGTLYNYGTIVQSGAGNFGLASEGAYYTTLDNEQGGTYLIKSNSGIDLWDGGITSVVNAGTIIKTAGTGTSQLHIAGPLTNTGTIETQSGGLYLDANSMSQVSGSTLTGGTWNAMNGATLQFPGGTNITVNQANINLSGPGATISGLGALAENDGAFALLNSATFTTPASTFANTGLLTLGVATNLSFAGAFTQTSTGTLAEQVAGSPESNQFGLGTITGTANLGGKFLLKLANGFTPTAGQAYSVLTFASAPSNFATFLGFGSTFSEAANPTGFDLYAFQNPADLQASNVAAPATDVAGQQITVTWQVSNEGPASATGSWQDSVYLSPTSAINASSILLGTAAHGGGLSVNGTYSGSLSVIVPPLASGSYYVIVQVDSRYQVSDANRGNNSAAATGQLSLGLPSLSLGMPLNDSFTVADQDRYYQLSVPAGGALSIALQSAAASGATALYASQGTLPTPYNAQVSSVIANRPNQTVTVPQVLTGGIYYILAHSISGAAATSGYTLSTSQSTALSVAAPALPYTGGNAGNATIEIDGANFGPDTTAKLTLGATTLNATSMDYSSAAQVFATFNLTGVAVGSYTLTVSSGAQTATAATSFQVAAASKPSNPIHVKVVTPSAIRPGRTGVVALVVVNTSANDAPAPAVYLSSDGAIFKMPSDAAFEDGSEIRFLVASPTGPAGILAPGESVTVLVGCKSTTTDPALDFNGGQLDGGHPSLQGTLESSDTDVSVAGLTIRATDTVSGAEYDATVLSDGSFVFAGIGVGTFTFSMDGLLLTAPPQVTVSADRSLTGVALNATLGVELGGEVQSQSTLVGIAGAAVQVSNEATNQTFHVITDSNGDYSFTGLAPGAYDLVVNADGYARGDILGLDLTAGDLRESPLLALASSLTGTVTLASGGASETKLQVTASISGSTDANQTFSASTTSSAFTLTGLGVGSYDVTLALPGYITQHLSVAVVTPGQSVDLGNITLNPASEIDGTVTSTDPNNPAAEIKVEALQNGTVVAGAVTDSSGNFQITDLQPGTYSLSVQGGVIIKGPTVTVGLGQTVTGESILVQPGGAISGKVSGPTEAPIPGMTVYLSEAGGATITTTTDSNGKYQFTGLPAGGYRVYLLIGGQGTWQTVSVTDVDGTPATANLSLAYAATISGTLTDASSNPITDGAVTLFQSGKAVASAQADSSGNYHFLILQPGTFDLAATAPEGTFNAAISVVVASGGSVTQDFQAGSSTLTVTVIDGGQSVVGDLVTLESIVDGVAQGQATSTVGADGTVTFSGLVAGNYTAISSNAGGDFGQATVTVPASGSSTLSVALVTQTGLSGTISDSAGSPISGATVDAQMSLDPQQSYTATTAADGTYSLVALPPGVYDITVFADQYAATTQAAVSISTTVTISATLSASTTIIKGTLVDTAGNPVPTGFVGVSDASGHLLGHAQVNPDGTFSISSASGRSLTLQVYATGYGVPNSVVINAPAEQMTQVSAIVLQELAIDPNPAQRFTSSPASAPVSPFGVAFAEAMTSYANSRFNQISPASPPPAPDCQACGPAYTKVLDLASFVTQQDADLNLEISAVKSLASLLTRQYWLEIARMTTLNLLATDGAVLSVLGVRSLATAVVALENIVQAGLPFLALRLKDIITEVEDAVTGAADFWHSAIDIGSALSYEEIQQADGKATDAAEKEKELIREALTACLSLPASSVIKVALESKVTSAIWFVVEPEVETILDSIYNGVPYIVNFLNNVLVELTQGDPFQYTLAAAAELNSAVQSMDDGYSIWENEHWSFVNAKNDLAICEQNSCNPVPQPQSQDPNAIIGPAGYGSQGFIQPTGNLPYAVEFENDGTAAAQDVTVTQKLDANLDWSTFQLGSFGFGSVDVIIPAGLTQYQTTVNYQNDDGTDLNVLVNVEFNVATGMLTASFTSLDTATGQAPAGVFDGFLYPDSESVAGSQGYVEYTVQPLASLTTGAVVTQEASVVFDTNSAISTVPPAVNTIDSGAELISTIGSLPVQESTSFSVSWSGEDPEGSGVASYSIYVSDNGGPFEPFMIATTQTSATFTGVVGHTYGFYSVATDDVGNVQPAPRSAQASTQVVLSPDTTPPTSSVTALPATESSLTFTVSWSGQDNTGGSGLASYSIFVSDNGGAFTPFLTQTTQTSASFTGVNGHTYGFYSIAVDNAGNVEPTPSSAQATTRVVVNTDSTPPTSSVTALPKLVQPSFTVSWSGQDNSGGSGIASYTIYVSDNGGPFTPWLTGTTTTSAVYAGVAGHSYAFYSTAADLAGNVQPKPNAAQASATALLDTPDKIYVDAVYVDLLGRTPDVTGLNYWSGQLSQGVARAMLINLIDHSAEYFGTIIKPAYQQFLGRTADASGLAYWTGQMAGGLSDERLEAGFIGSTEFFNHSGGTNKGWVDAMYQDLLGRQPDAGGETFWINQLNAGADRAGVAYGFAASAEREAQHVQADYLKYLGRSAGQSEVDYWLGQFLLGKTNEDIVTGFVGSDEYYKKHS